MYSRSRFAAALVSRCEEPLTTKRPRSVKHKTETNARARGNVREKPKRPSTHTRKRERKGLCCGFASASLPKLRSHRRNVDWNSKCRSASLSTKKPRKVLAPCLSPEGVAPALSSISAPSSVDARERQLSRRTLLATHSSRLLVSAEQTGRPFSLEDVHLKSTNKTKEMTKLSRRVHNGETDRTSSTIARAKTTTKAGRRRDS